MLDNNTCSFNRMVNAHASYDLIEIIYIDDRELENEGELQEGLISQC